MFNFANINSVRPVVRKALRFQKSGLALDLGCGVGRHALFLAKKGFTVTAVDEGSEKTGALKELARLQNLKIAVRKGDATAFTSARRFDLVLSSMFLHFLEGRAQRDMVTRMQEFTKRGGINVVTEYSDRTKEGTRPQLVDPEKMKGAYEDAGWEVLHFDHRLGVPMPSSKNPKKMVRYWVLELIARRPY